jgi:hypothetical protein
MMPVKKKTTWNMFAIVLVALICSAKGQPSGVTFLVADADRVADQPNVDATFTFTPSAGGAGPTSVTLNYPSGFFATSATPTAKASTAGATLTPAQPGALYIVLTVGGSSPLAAGTAVTVTLVGCTIGPARAASDSVTVQTNTDPTASSPAVSCGRIGGAVTAVTFLVAAFGRFAYRTNVEATFTFTPSSGGAGPSNITLNYPSGFFSTYATPTAKASTAGATLTPMRPGALSIVLTVGGSAPLAAGTAVTVTLVGCTIGPARAASDSVTVQTNTDPTASSPAVSCGTIGSAVDTVNLNIHLRDRVAGKQNVEAAFTFRPSAGGAGPTSVTLNYALGFFATSATPTANVSTAGATLTPAQPGAFSIVLTVGGSAPLAALNPVIVTLVGCTMGPARAASDSVTVQTNTDPTASSPPVSCGRIGGAVTGVSFDVADDDRVAAKAGVDATFTFAPSAGGAGPTSVTLNYPSGFFATSATPTAKVSTAGATLTPAQPGAFSIVLTVGGSAPLWTFVTVTLVGCTMGPPTAGGNVNVSTSADPTLSDSVDSQYIGGAVTEFSFFIPDASRKANKANVMVSFRFTPSAGGGLDSIGFSRITLAYPIGFFASDVIPTAIISGNAEAVSGLSTSSNIVITLKSGSVVAGEPVVVALSGMTIGAVGTEGGPVTLTTTRDPLPSSTASGSLNCSSLSGSYCPNIYGASQPCLAGYYCPFSDMSQEIECPGGTFNPNNWSRSIEACVPCPLGKFCPQGSAVGTDCPAGTYNDKPDIDSESGCNPCPKGYRCSPPEGSITPCACKLFEFQPDLGQLSCLPCPLTTSLNFGATSCQSEAATSSSSLLVYYYLIVALFASIAMIATVLTARLVRSRHTSSMRFVRFGMCLYVAMFVPYAVLQAITLGKLATLNNDRSSVGRDTVRISSSAAFAAFFGLGFSGKVALVQRWTYVVNLHTSGSHASPLGLQSTLRSTYKTFVWAIVVIVVLYLMGFSTLTNRFMDSVGRCAKLQDETCVSVTKGVEGLQQPCSETLMWTNALQYYEGIWAAAVLVVFTFLAFLFNGVVFAM